VDSAKYEDMEAENIWRAHTRIVYITYEYIEHHLSLNGAFSCKIPVFVCLAVRLG
jgi:hypothetical protein